MSNQHEVLWVGRLKERPESGAFAFQASINVDKRLALDDIRGSVSHAVMLGKQGIIPKEAAAAIERELAKIAEELKTGSLEVDTTCEDVHSFLEAELTARLGDTGRMVHAGRSRNDQVATAFRLYLKHAVPDVEESLAAAVECLLDISAAHTEHIMPGYTHLQRAQPVTLGFHLCAWACALLRDYGRFQDALSRLNQCPLGAGALAGTTLPLDRNFTARELGFSGPTLNAMDSVSDRDFALELANCCLLTMTHLSRFCEDIVLWASSESGFIDLSEAWSTGSSIMPQKKNPDFAELIRGKTGRVSGNLITLVTMLKGLPYSYNKDLQEDKEALFDSLDTTKLCLAMFTGMLSTAKFNTARMEAACTGGFLEATDAAEYLVKKGVPFRKAHEIASLVTRDCIEAGVSSIRERTLEQLRQRAAEFDEGIFAALTPRACVEGRSLPGGTAPEEVRRQIVELRALLRKTRKLIP